MLVQTSAGSFLCVSTHGPPPTVLRHPLNRLTGDSKLPVNVSVNGCFFIYISALSEGENEIMDLISMYIFTKVHLVYFFFLGGGGYLKFL